MEELGDGGAAGAAIENAVSKPSNKKLKKGGKKNEEAADVAAAPAPAPAPMEKQKKRKAMDKERRRSVTESKEPELKQKAVESKENNFQASTSSSSMPEFHISVFQELASADASVREAAVGRMVEELQEVQKAYDRLENKALVENGTKLEAEKDDGLNSCAPSLRYAIRRLIRGVSSSRECARQGFALGLSIIVRTIPSVKVDSLLKLVVDLLEVSSSMKGQEVKDCLLGRLFCYGSLARSDRLTEEWAADKNTPYIKDFVGALISLAVKKRYLQEPAVSIILELVEKLPAEALSSHVLEAPGIREWFEGAADAGNPDALLLALKIAEKLPDNSMVFGKLLPCPFSASKFFSTEHLSSIDNCFKESTFCQPRVHSVWNVLINILLPNTILQAEDAASVSTSLKKHKKSRKSNSSEEEIAKSVRCFCEVVIEGSLLQSSHDRKHLALDILLLLLPRLPSSVIPIVLSYKIVQCLTDVLSTKDSWLYKAAQHFVKELVDLVAEDDVKRVAVIVALQKHSNGKFDSITKTKTVKDMMSGFKSEAGCLLFIQNLTNMFIDEGQVSEEPSDQSQTTDENSEIGSVEDKYSTGVMASSDFLKTWVIESLPSILKHLNFDMEANLRLQKEILKFLAVQGLFSASLGNEVTSFELQEKFRWPKVPTSSALCRMCVEQLQSLMANAHKIEEPRTMANGVEPNDLGSYFMRFLTTLRNIPSVSFFQNLSDDDENAIKKLQEMESKLSREEKNFGLSADGNKLHALRHLLIQLMLQILLRPGELSDTASEIVICCKKAFASSDILNSSGEDELEGDGDALPELMDVLVDTLLSLLPQSSAPMRSAIEQVFKYFCVDVTSDGLLRMLRIIKKDLKPARHRDEDDDDNDDDDDLLGIEEDEEVEEEAETAETAESDGQTDDSEAVGGAEEAGKESDEDEDEDEDSDSGMDDDAMFRMDTYLAQIFKEKKNQAGGGETAQSQLIIFKLRILSLLEIYLHENRGKPQVLTVFSNLAQAFVNPNSTEGSEQLGQRLWGILQKKIFKEKKLPSVDAAQLPTLESLLEKYLKLASKPFKRKKSAGTLSKQKLAAFLNRQKMVVSLAQNSTYLVLKIMDSGKFSDAEKQRAFDILQGAVLGYFDSKKSQIKSGFLREVFRRNPWIGHHLCGFVLEKCASAKSDFRRVDSLDMVMEVLGSVVPLNSKENNNINQDASKKFVKKQLESLSNLIEALVTKMPTKQARRAEVRKFCGKILEIISTLDLTKMFLKRLSTDAATACESQLGEVFTKFKRSE